MAEICAALTGLRCLDLSSCVKLGALALGALGGLTALTQLALCGLSARRVSDGAIAAALQRLPWLQVLSLAFCRQARACPIPYPRQACAPAYPNLPAPAAGARARAARAA